MIHFGIVGILGRMGRSIAQESEKDPVLKCIKGFDNPGHTDFKKMEQSGLDLGAHQIIIEALEAENLKGIDGVIDFSMPGATMMLLESCAQKKIPVVIGTTGFSNIQLNKISEYSKIIPILLSSNMSIGVNLLFALVNSASGALKDKNFNPEIFEIHHKHKKDAPSGTAKTLEGIIQKNYNLSSDEITHGRSGIIGERPEKELGVFALRGGDVVGDHTVFFLGDGERVELKHQATSRNVFANGALNALKFIVKKDPGLYNMFDVLQIKMN